jgi:hypothetical protein
MITTIMSEVMIDAYIISDRFCFSMPFIFLTLNNGQYTAYLRFAMAGAIKIGIVYSVVDVQERVFGIALHRTGRLARLVSATDSFVECVLSIIAACNKSSKPRSLFLLELK